MRTKNILLNRSRNKYYNWKYKFNSKNRNWINQRVSWGKSIITMTQ